MINITPGNPGTLFHRLLGRDLVFPARGRSLVNAAKCLAGHYPSGTRSFGAMPGFAEGRLVDQDGSFIASRHYETVAEPAVPLPHRRIELPLLEAQTRLTQIVRLTQASTSNKLGPIGWRTVAAEPRRRLDPSPYRGCSSGTSEPAIPTAAVA